MSGEGLDMGSLAKPLLALAAVFNKPSHRVILLSEAARDTLVGIARREKIPPAGILEAKLNG